MVLLVGLPASGKSTFYQATFAATHKLLSKDLMGRGSGKEGKLQKLVTEMLGKKERVCIDNCNMLDEHRLNLIEIARFFDVPVHCYVFAFDLAGCFRRNDQRKGKALVPKVAMLARRKEYVAPAWDEGYARMFDVHLIEAQRTFKVTERTR
jgi:predicted kinase